jgi:manganese efflux pump family protein
MSWFMMFAIAIGLAMDAFAVAIITGLTLTQMTKRHVFRLAFHFGLFQALMPALGWAAGTAVHGHIATYDHWIAFGLLGFVGGKMIVSVFDGTGHRRTSNDPTTGWDLVMLSVATSIDALAVGISLAVVRIEILLPALLIGIVAATLTAIGMVLGRRIGAAWGKRVEVLGGLILICIGVQILIKHLSAA